MLGPIPQAVTNTDRKTQGIQARRADAFDAWLPALLAAWLPPAVDQAFRLAGDYRLMAAGNGRIGIPELLVGVPFPPSVIEAIRFALPPQHLQMLMYTGRTFPPDDALRLGIVDKVVDPASLPARAEEMARVHHGEAVGVARWRATMMS